MLFFWQRPEGVLSENTQYKIYTSDCRSSGAAGAKIGTRTQPVAKLFTSGLLAVKVSPEKHVQKFGEKAQYREHEPGAARTEHAVDHKCTSHFRIHRSPCLSRTCHIPSAGGRQSNIHTSAGPCQLHYPGFSWKGYSRLIIITFQTTNATEENDTL